MSEQKTSSSWVNMKPEEVESKIIALAKEGTSPERIGLILRDEHGIPKSKLLGIKVKKTLVKAKLWKDSEKLNLKDKTDKLHHHITTNKHDYSATRSHTRHKHTLAKLEKR